MSGDALAACGADEASFRRRLVASLDAWRREGARGVWLDVPASQVAFLAPALQLGFELHHVEPAASPPQGQLEVAEELAEEEEEAAVTLTYWFPGERGEPCTLPAGNSHTVGVGAVVMNAAGQLLAVQERSGPAAALSKSMREKSKQSGDDRAGFWKMPTGLVGAGEDSCEAAAREVWEETGVEVAVEKLVALREAHAPPKKGKSGGEGKAKKPSSSSSTNMFLVFLCRPKDEAAARTVRRQESEILRCEWMDADEFLSRQATVMKPGSLYHRLNELAVEVARSGKEGGGGAKEDDTDEKKKKKKKKRSEALAMDIHELPMGFRPGTNRAYFFDGTPPSSPPSSPPPPPPNSRL